MAKEKNQEQTGEAVSAPATGIQKPQILTASTIDELNKQIEDIKKNLTEGQTITCGAIARNRDNGTYSIRIDIIYNKYIATIWEHLKDRTSAS